MFFEHALKNCAVAEKLQSREAAEAEAARLVPIAEEDAAEEAQETMERRPPPQSTTTTTSSSGGGVASGGSGSNPKVPSPTGKQKRFQRGTVIVGPNNGGSQDSTEEKDDTEDADEKEEVQLPEPPGAVAAKDSRREDMYRPAP